jgi:hypothetical protein
MQGFSLVFTWICLRETRPLVVVLGAGLAAFGRALTRRLGRQRPAVAPDPVRLARRAPEAQRAHPALAAAAKRVVEPAAHLGILRAFAGDEHHAGQQAGRPCLALFGPRHDQHRPSRAHRLERKDEPSGGFQRVEPDANGMRGSGADIDGVGLRQLPDTGACAITLPFVPASAARIAV